MLSSAGFPGAGFPGAGSPGAERFLAMAALSSSLVILQRFSA
jgi:hypothetical protein